MFKRIAYKNQQELDVISFLLALNGKFYRFNGGPCYFINHEDFPNHFLVTYSTDYLIGIMSIDDYSYEYTDFYEFMTILKNNYSNKFINNCENIDDKYFHNNTLMLPILDTCVLILNKDEVKIVDFDPELLEPTTKEELINIIENNDKNYLCDPYFLSKEDQ